METKSEETLKKEADEIKAKGNDFFKKKKYLQAIEMYTKAIGMKECVAHFL